MCVSRKSTSDKSGQLQERWVVSNLYFLIYFFLSALQIYFRKSNCQLPKMNQLRLGVLDNPRRPKQRGKDCGEAEGKSSMEVVE